MKTRLNKAVVVLLILLTIGVLRPYVRPPEPVVQQIDQQTIDQIVEQVVLRIEPSIIELASVNFGELAEMDLGILQGDDLMVIDDVSGPTTKGITVSHLFSNTVPHTGTDAIFTGGLTVDTTTLVVDDTNDRVSIGAASTSFGVEIVSDEHFNIKPDGTWSTGDESFLYMGDGGVYISGRFSERSVWHAFRGTRIESDQGIVATFGTQTSLDAGFPGRITTTRGISVGGFITIAVSGAPQTITDGTGDIDPTGSYHEIQAAGAVANTMDTAGFTKGMLVTLVNVGSNAVTITDTGTTMLSATFAMGQYDTLSLKFDGTNWLELARSDN